MGVGRISVKLARVSIAAVPILAKVDKSPGYTPNGGVFFGVAHFGELLRRLRLERGLSQEGLAAAARVSGPTIRNAEKQADSKFFGTTASAILKALEKEARLSDKDRASFASMAGIPAYVDALPEPAAAEDPDSVTAVMYVQRLLQEAGPTRTIAALEALAAAWDLDLPPRVRSGVQAIKHQVQVGDVKATVYTPVDQPPQPAPPRPNRRTA